jgi:hypothetical protein
MDAVRRRSGLAPVIVKGFAPEIDAMIKRFYEGAEVNLSAKIKLFSETKDVELLMEMLESAQKVGFEEVVFEQEETEKWKFTLRGTIHDKNGGDK